MEEGRTCDVSDAEKVAEDERRIHKRRSLVFQTRRSSTHTEADGGKEPRDEKEAKVRAEVDEDSRRKDEEEGRDENLEEERFELADYVERLRRERKLWIETWRQRKAERKILTGRKSSAEARGQCFEVNVLSDSQRAFVLARPNYEEISQDRRKLIAVAMKVAALNRLARKLNQRFISQMEEKLYDVTKRIIKMSDS